MKKLRVLMISYSCVVDTYRKHMEHLGAVEGLECSLLVPEHWHQAGAEVYLDAKSADNYRIIASQPNDFHFKKSSYRNVFHYYPGLEAVIRETAPDIIDIWGEPFFLLSWHALKLRNRSFGNIRVNVFSAQNIYKNYLPPVRWFEDFTLKNVDYATPVCAGALEVMKKKGLRAPARVIGMGADTSLFRPLDSSAKREELGLTGSFVIGYAGKLLAEKGIFDLVDAVSQMKQRDVKLLMIGQGDRGALLEYAAAKGLKDRLVLSGGLRHKEIPSYYNCMDCIAVPSKTMKYWKEQFGRVIVEAMACGLPVVGSSSGEIPHTIGAAGLVFKEGQAGELAEMLGYLRDNPSARKSLGEKGLKRVMDNFTYPVLAGERNKVYRIMAGGRA